MRTPRLPVVDWTDTPANLNWLVRFAERPNLVSARVLSRSERTILSTRTHRIPHCSCYSLHKLVRCVSQKHGVTVCPSCAQWPVCQQRSTGWSIPCASSYLMNRDLQIASHFKWGWAFVLDVPTLLVTYHHTHSDPSKFHSVDATRNACRIVRSKFHFTYRWIQLKYLYIPDALMFRMYTLRLTHSSSTKAAKFRIRIYIARLEFKNVQFFT